MEITWLGHSSFRLKGSHSIVITDPYPPELGYDPGKLSARIVTSSHGHPNHSYFAGIEGEPRPVMRPGEYEIGDVSIFGIASFHDSEQGHIRGKNTIFVIKIDDVTVCHLGDLGQALNAEQHEKMDDVDVLLVPVGGFTTLNAQSAVEVVREIEPRVVIPMHYKTPAVNVDLDTAEAFLKEIGSSVSVPQPKLNVSKSSIPEGMQVVLLDYPHRS